MRSRFLAPVAVYFIALFLVAGISLLTWPTPPAHAASGDVINSFKIDYVVREDGVVEVTETIDYSFASNDSHGIFRDLITREPYDNTQDQLYNVSNIEVTSPTGASAQFDTTDEKLSRRESYVRIKIGSASRVVSSGRATYQISYQVRGALRNFADHSEFYWDATGAGWDARVTNIDVTVTVPQGATQVACFAGAHGTTDPCTSATIQTGTARFSEASLKSQQGLTVVVGIPAGAVSNDTPILSPAVTIEEAYGITPQLVGGSVGVLGLGGLSTFIYSRLGNRDRRFANTPPGVIPGDPANTPVTTNYLADDQIPVRFDPPPISVAEAGLLIDATANSRETTATLIDLAVHGAVKISNSGHTQSATLVDPTRATRPWEMALIDEMFSGLTGTTMRLGAPRVGDHRMANANDELIKSLRQHVSQARWYLRMPGAMRGTMSKIVSRARSVQLGVLCVGAAFTITPLLAGIGALDLKSGQAVFLLITLIGLAVLGFLTYRIHSQGVRSATGRALTDQILGFRKYLATAEAEQLKFEEGEDIFSRYLPWAIAFDLVDRWQKVCADLVRVGRLDPQPGTWYSGPSYFHSGFTMGWLSNTVTTAFSPPPSPSTSGGGGGSSSGFSSGGGFSGGGGGGGGGGSW